MGQEVHQQGLIVSIEINGCDVLVELTGDHFSLAMLEMHLQTDHPGSEIITPANEVKWDSGKATVAVRFSNQEDAMHFHLRH